MSRVNLIMDRAVPIDKSAPSNRKEITYLEPLVRMYLRGI
jgi:hypothetical protein